MVAGVPVQETLIQLQRSVTGWIMTAMVLLTMERQILMVMSCATI
jgi:hypothetical protein